MLFWMPKQSYFLFYLNFASKSKEMFDLRKCNNIIWCLISSIQKTIPEHQFFKVLSHSMISFNHSLFGDKFQCFTNQRHGHFNVSAEVGTQGFKLTFRALPPIMCHTIYLSYTLEKRKHSKVYIC